MPKDTQPIKKEDIPKNPDKHIDQDFEGYPHPPSKDEIIKPRNETDELTSGIVKKQPQSNIPRKPVLRKELDDVDEQNSDGSGGAFSGTENNDEN